VLIARTDILLGRIRGRDLSAGQWQRDPIGCSMTMTLEKALAFKLPNGKTLGSATVEELKAELGKDAVPDWAEGLDPSTLG
jgi:hypothetical protein